jgi:hypothetical protein
MVRLEVTDPARLDEVSGEIHDWFYDLDDVVYDPWRAELVIPFRRWSYDEARPAPRGRGLRGLVPRLLRRGRRRGAAGGSACTRPMRTG